MTVTVEFIGYFRVKSGTDYIEVEIPEESSMLDFTRAVEDRLAEKKFSILDGEELKEGVLLFRRKPNGGLERCRFTDSLSSCGGRVLMANLMGGG